MTTPTLRDKVSMKELRSGLGGIINQVKMGKTFHITRAGRVVALLSPPKASALDLLSAIKTAK